MKIGILNTGNVGSRLARVWAVAGHQLKLAKDGEDRKIAPLLAELANEATLGTIKEAAEYGDALLFSVYWPRADAVIEAAGSALAGNVVIETMNPLGVSEDFVHFHDHAFMRDSSTAEYLQERLPDAKVVKAFNLLAAPALESDAWSSSASKPSIFYATDHTDAGQVVRKLIEDAGFTPINAGPLKAARQLEQLGVLLHQVAENEYGGDADLMKLGVSVVEAIPGPVVRERIA